MRKLCIVFLFSICSIAASAQFNVERLMSSGEAALHYEDYVLSIQYFSQAIAKKTYLYEDWYDRAIAKYYLEDFIGSESDASKAIDLNPYIDGIYDLRAITRIRQEKLDDAIFDYGQAIRINPMEKNYWYNRAICFMNKKDYGTAL